MAISKRRIYETTIYADSTAALVKQAADLAAIGQFVTALDAEPTVSVEWDYEDGFFVLKVTGPVEILDRVEDATGVRAVTTIYDSDLDESEG